MCTFARVIGAAAAKITTLFWPVVVNRLPTTGVEQNLGILSIFKLAHSSYVLSCYDSNGIAGYVWTGKEMKFYFQI